MNYLGANMKLIVECSQKLVRLGENLWGKEQKLDKEMQEHQKLCDEIMAIQGIEPIEADLETDFEYEGLAYSLPDGYIFKDENGNVINATKIVLEKKKEYPKTYEECLSVLGIYNGLQDVEIYNAKPSECELFETLIHLKRCRDAYWKLYGEEMGLGKPWEPDWYGGSLYLFYYNPQRDEFVKTRYSQGGSANSAFVFPTAEMRDAYMENFDPDIEKCKLLL